MRYRPDLTVRSKQGIFRRTFSEDDPGVRTLRERVGSENIHSFSQLLLYWCALLGDSPDKKPNSVIAKFIKQFCDDPYGLLKDYSSLADQIINSLVRSDSKTCIITGFVDGMKDTPIFREYLTFYRQKDSSYLRYILSFLHFGKKVNIQSIDLETSAFRAWLEVEEELSHPVSRNILPSLRAIMHVLLEGFSADSFLPKHGPGAVSERNVRGSGAKNEHFSLPKKIRYAFFSESMPVFGGREHCSDFGLEISDIPLSSVNYSTLRFVPKSWKSYRSICMEPIAYQWAQQGVRLWLESAIGRGVGRRFINFQSQEDNQLLAKLGSYTGWTSTIDLSSASDRVRTELVKEIFPREVLYFLLATRSCTVKTPDGEVRHVHKFAPMGSALCFPIQSLIFLSVVLLVSISTESGAHWSELSLEDLSLSELRGLIMKIYPRSELKDFPLWRLSPVRIYGDDIICDNTIASNVMDALESIGFKVNRDKTFTGTSAYRESCGKHYFLGHDVSPLTLKLKDSAPKVSVAELSSIIDAANLANELGYSTLRRHLVQRALYTPVRGVKATRAIRQNPILFSEEGLACSITPHGRTDNSHLRVRRFGESSKDSSSHLYQRDEYQCIGVGAASIVNPVEEFDWYYHCLWWRSQYHNSKPPDIGDTTVKAAESLDTRARLVWVPV